MTIKEKLLNIQAELKAPKSQYNSHGNYNYRSCEDILEAVKPLCVKYKALPLLTDDIVQIGNNTYVKATAGLLDLEGGTPSESITANGFAREAPERKGFDVSQITGAASSYARKYALNALFAIDDTKDADSDETLQKPQNKPAGTQNAKPVQKPAQAQNKPLTLKEAMQEEVEIKGTSYRLGALREDQLDWIIKHSEGRTKEAAALIRKEKFKSALEDEQGEIPFD